MTWIALHRRVWADVSDYFRTWRDTAEFGFGYELMVVGFAGAMLMLCMTTVYWEELKLFACLPDIHCPPNRAEVEKVAMTSCYAMIGIVMGMLAGGITSRIHRHRQSKL